MRKAVTFIIFSLLFEISIAQSFDTTYSVFAYADSSTFINTAKSKGWNVRYDSVSRMLFTNFSNVLYSKPIVKDTSAYFLALMISSKDSIIINTILKNRKRITWSTLFYRPWTVVNQVDHQTWYRLLVYKKNE